MPNLLLIAGTGTKSGKTTMACRIKDLIPEGTPIICESPALRNFIEPGVFIIITSDTTNKHKNISHFQDLPHVIFKLEELNKIIIVPVGFKNGRWHDFSM